MSTVHGEGATECLERKACGSHGRLIPTDLEVLDADVLAELVRYTSPAALVKMFEVFEGETRRRLARMPGTSGHSLYRELHTLKSSAATFGGIALAQVASSLESQVVGPWAPSGTDLNTLQTIAEATLTRLRVVIL